VSPALVAQVVEVLYVTSGRLVTESVVKAWALALQPYPDGPDAVEVAAAVARTQRSATVHDYCQALTDRRRHQPRPDSAGELEEEVPLPPEENARRLEEVRDQLRDRFERHKYDMRGRTG
jgi:hypothetical protein